MDFVRTSHVDHEPMMRRILILTCLAVLARAAATGAQPAPQPEQAAGPSLLARLPDLAAASVQADAGQDQPPSGSVDRRACEGCPPRSVGKALLHATIINGAYEAANLIRGQVTARITPKTWWANMEQGWVWDLDDFLVNQVGHPYQGNNYFNAGRSNGLSFYESAAVTAFGSGTWEYFGETNKPSLNDFINTTLGGIALGEMFHRAGWLVRNTRATGRGRIVERDRRDRPRSGDGRESVPHGRCVARHRQAAGPGAVEPRRVHVGRRALARLARPARSRRPASRSSRWTCCTETRKPGAAGRRTTRSR